MPKIVLDPTKVIIDDSKIIEISVRSNLEALGEPDGKTYDLNASYRTSVAHPNPNNAILDFTLNIENNGAPTYDVTIATRTKFSFMQEASTEAQDVYLMSIGLSRVMDYAKTYVKTITTFGMHGNLDIPGIPFQLESDSEKAPQ